MRFSELRERLLCAGIAPRHVRRYIRELNDHFDDLRREEIANGANVEAAEAAARARLGRDEVLAGVMLARPELRSLAARFPWAVFGLGPIVMLALIVFAGIFAEAGIIFSIGMIFPNLPVPRVAVPWARFAFDIYNYLVTYAAPLAIAAMLCAIGVKQRANPRWILLASATACVVGGFYEVAIKWSNVPGRPNELSAGFAFAPPFPRAMIVAGMVRASVNLALISAAYMLMRRKEFSTAE